MAERFGPPYWQPGAFEQVNGFPRYPAGEMERRHRFARELMATDGLDALVIGGPTGPLETSVQFFSNWPSQVQSYVVFVGGEEPVLMVRLWNHLPDAERISMISDVRYGGDTPAEQAIELGRMLARAGVRRAGLIGVVPHGDLFLLQRENPTASFLDVNAAYQAFRLVKTEAEMTFVRIASAMNDAAVAALAHSLAPGMNEYEVARIVEDTYLGHRAWNLIHFSLTTPMDDPGVCVPHQYHPDRVLQAGDVFVTEISTTFWGYAGQILRTFTVGGGPNDRYARLHDVALRAYRGIVDVLAPGTTVGQVLDAAEAIGAEGFDIWDDLVHGFGGAYLPPIVRTRGSRGATHPDDFVYPDGALVVVQPNVIDGEAGVQVGNSMWLKESGTEVTQRYPTELIVCE
jgi:Xaa-Pro aminopeptidase